MIRRRKSGREVLYRVDASRLDEATRAMTEVARRWDQRLGTIKRLAEAVHEESKRTLPQRGTERTRIDRLVRTTAPPDRREVCLPRPLDRTNQRTDAENRTEKEPTMQTPPIVSREDWEAAEVLTLLTAGWAPGWW